MITSLDETCYVFAARYAHGRSTGASYAVVSALKQVWSQLSPRTRDQIIRESHEAQHCLSDWADLREFAASKCKWTLNSGHDAWITQCGASYGTSDFGCSEIKECPHCHKETTT